MVALDALVVVTAVPSIHRTRRIAVCLEVTPKQAVASPLDWPGWCRAGRDEGAALEALASYAERYAPVAEQAGVSFPSTVAFDVVERVLGDAWTRRTSARSSGGKGRLDRISST